MIARFYDRRLGHNPASNFFPSEFRAPHWRFESEGTVVWRTVEHYYQAAKSVTLVGAEKIRRASSPKESKRLGRQCELHPRFEEEKLAIMRRAISLKFAPGSELAEWLIETHPHGLIEGNDWGDRFWGVDDTGENWLGWLLMAQRSWLLAK